MLSSIHYVIIRMSRALPYTIFFLAVAARAAVSARTLTSDISILIHNDLLGKKTHLSFRSRLATANYQAHRKF